jgi:hypothetical protein
MREGVAAPCPEIQVAARPRGAFYVGGTVFAIDYYKQEMPTAPPKDQIPSTTPIWRRLFSLKKLPGVILVAIGVGWRVLDWGGRLDFLWHAIEALGGDVAMIVSIVSSPLFSVGLIAVGVSYVVWVGEPVVATIRHPLVPVIGWGFVILCISALGATLIFGYFVSTLTNDPDALYQNLTPVARVSIPQIDDASMTVTFTNVTTPTGTLLDMSQPFMFRHKRIICSGKPQDRAASRLPAPISYPDLLCRIQK